MEINKISEEASARVKWVNKQAIETLCKRRRQSKSVSQRIWKPQKLDSGVNEQTVVKRSFLGKSLCFEGREAF